MLGAPRFVLSTLDSKRLFEIPGIVVRHSLCRDAGSAERCFGLASISPSRPLGRMNCDPKFLNLAVGVGPIFLDCGRLCARKMRGVDPLGLSRLAIEYISPGGCGSGLPKIRRVLRWRTGSRGRSYGRTAAPVSSSSRLGDIHRRETGSDPSAESALGPLRPSVHFVSAFIRARPRDVVDLFSTRARRPVSEQIFKIQPNPDGLARLAYTYLHWPIVAGIILFCGSPTNFVLTHSGGPFPI